MDNLFYDDQILRACLLWKIISAKPPWSGVTWVYYFPMISYPVKCFIHFIIQLYANIHISYLFIIFSYMLHDTVVSVIKWVDPFGFVVLYCHSVYNINVQNAYFYLSVYLYISSSHSTFAVDIWLIFNCWTLEAQIYPFFPSGRHYSCLAHSFYDLRTMWTFGWAETNYVCAFSTVQ